MKAINLHDLSRFRGVLMGIAMLVVMMFHVGFSRHDTFWFCVNRCGNVGVDMFLFLSKTDFGDQELSVTNLNACLLEALDHCYDRAHVR